MSTPVRVSILEILRTGGFTDLPFGMTRDAFIGKVGDTDRVVFSSRGDRFPSLLRYGDVEFFLTTDSHLLYGFLWEPTNTEVPEGTPRLRIEPWILKGGISRTAIEQGLREEKIAFTGHLRADGVYSLFLMSGVSLDFFGDGEGQDSDTLCAVSAMHFDLVTNQEQAKQISVTFTVREVERMKTYAARQGISVAHLCAGWVRQRLVAEEDVRE